MSDHADHHPFQAHHFDDMDQQFDAGKLGMWLFLATEVLFFSGMFVAYTIFRVNHPEVFVNAHHYLDKWLGAFNTVVLLASSLSVAWGVRCAQLDNRKGLVACLVFTLGCAGLFMGVKAVEYTLKFYEGVFWAGDYAPPAVGSHPDLTVAYATVNNIAIGTAVVGGLLIAGGFFSGLGKQMRGWVLLSLGVAVASVALGIVGAQGIQSIEPHLESAQNSLKSALGFAVETTEHGEHGGTHDGEHDASHQKASHDEGEGHDTEENEEGTESAIAADNSPAVDEDLEPFAGQPIMVPGADRIDPSKIELAIPTSNERRYEGIFFSIYYAMTGVHALHILGGIGVIVWITGRSALGQFSHAYFGPVEYVGLYWHLVDLIWIFLFPLLYLIH